MSDEPRPGSRDEPTTDDAGAGEIEITGYEGMPADAPPPSATEDAREAGAGAASAAGDEAPRRELESLREDLLRVRADFENFRKRQERDAAELRRRAAADMVERLLPVLDNFKRAMAVTEPEAGSSAFREGIELIFRQLMEVLEEAGLEPVATEGEPFDPNLHEAVAREETDAVDAHTVVAELEPGYMFRNRLLKPARVRVAVPSQDS